MAIELTKDPGSALQNQFDCESQCMVCEKIQKLFSSPPVQMHEEREMIDFGTLDEVLDADSCQIHVPVLQFCLCPSVEATEVVQIRGWKAVDGAVHLYGESIGCWASLRLLSTPSGLVESGFARFLNPEWIDDGLLHQWRQACSEKSSKTCGQVLDNSRLSNTCPDWLVDTSRMCLVQGSPGASYVALSYVWGKTSFFKTTKQTITQLQQESALEDAHNILGVPRTIADAIDVVRFLGERYLWVDALCIVQDDDAAKSAEINNMAAIYDSASLVIVAGQGGDADYGLRGIRGISQPRSLLQHTFRLPGGYEVVGDRVEHKPKSAWSQRGWTYQESLFARRKLTFETDSVAWECGCTNFEEVVGGNILNPANRVSDTTRFLSSGFPSMLSYGMIVMEFNDRNFTHPQDALSAFSGIMTALNRCFAGGFICGIPLLFLDTALCWRPFDVASSTCERRLPSNHREPTEMCLPSWSWLGWKCTIDWYDWKEIDSQANACGDSPSHLSAPQIVPIVEWYSKKWDGAERRYLGKHQQIAQKMKTAALEGNDDIPPGWTRFEYTPYSQLRWNSSDIVEPAPAREPWQHYYTHESNPNREFAYPVPTSFDTEDNGATPAIITDSLLCGRTRRAGFQIGEKMKDEAFFALQDIDGGWVGTLHAHSPPRDENESGGIKAVECELVVISEGYMVEGANVWGVEAWNAEERPKGLVGEKYEWYNVLWVEWAEGVAYRKGVGKVMKSAFDKQEVEWIDLVLE